MNVLLPPRPPLNPVRQYLITCSFFLIKFYHLASMTYRSKIRSLIDYYKADRSRLRRVVPFVMCVVVILTLPDSILYSKSYWIQGLQYLFVIVLMPCSVGYIFRPSKFTTDDLIGVIALSFLVMGPLTGAFLNFNSDQTFRKNARYVVGKIVEYWEPAMENTGGKLFQVDYQVGSDSIRSFTFTDAKGWYSIGDSILIEYDTVTPQHSRVFSLDQSAQSDFIIKCKPGVGCETVDYQNYLSTKYDRNDETTEKTYYLFGGAYKTIRDTYGSSRNSEERYVFSIEVAKLIEDPQYVTTSTEAFVMYLSNKDNMPNYKSEGEDAVVRIIDEGSRLNRSGALQILHIFNSGLTAVDEELSMSNIFVELVNY